jgi:hypothetical protein
MRKKRGYGRSMSECVVFFAGYEVLVGRNSRQNDTLTHRVATQYDLWFHAQGVPGSHVSSALRIAFWTTYDMYGLLPWSRSVMHQDRSKSEKPGKEE